MQQIEKLAQNDPDSATQVDRIYPDVCLCKHLRYRRAPFEPISCIDRIDYVAFVTK